MSRWADPDAAGSGVSGPNNIASNVSAYSSAYAGFAHVDATVNSYFTHFINNNAYPNGGPSTQDIINHGDPTLTSECPWTHNNCGLNDEPFSFHPAGCNSVFCDGSVHFLSEKISPTAMRAMITPNEGIVIPVGEFPN